MIGEYDCGHSSVLLSIFQSFVPMTALSSPLPYSEQNAYFPNICRQYRVEYFIRRRRHSRGFTTTNNRCRVPTEGRSSHSVSHVNSYCRSCRCFACRKLPWYSTSELCWHHIGYLFRFFLDSGNTPWTHSFPPWTYPTINPYEYDYVWIFLHPWVVHIHEPYHITLFLFSVFLVVSGPYYTLVLRCLLEDWCVVFVVRKEFEVDLLT